MLPVPFIPTLFCSSYYTTCLDESGNVYTFGYNTNGEVGQGKENKIYSLNKISLLSNIKSIACGDINCIFSDIDGNVFTIGDNSYGQLGIGNENKTFPTSHIPQKLIIPPIDSVYVGFFFAICLTMDGTLYSFGKNSNGELGIGNTENQSLPQHIPNLTDINIVSCGSDFTICRNINGECYSFGNGGYGVLGQNNNDSLLYPVKCLLYPKNIVDIKSGMNHSLILTKSGNVYGCGLNISGNLGLGSGNTIVNVPTLISSLKDIKIISCGYTTSMCIDMESNLWICGDNSSGQLGLGGTKQYGNYIRNPIKHPVINDVEYLSYKGFHTIIKKTSGEIYGFGYNDCSQLGIPKSESKSKPIQICKGNENIWKIPLPNSRQKSARK